MFALRQLCFGSPLDVLEGAEQASEPLEAGQVRVRTLACPIDPMDLLGLRGHYPLTRPLPAVPGAEGVAEVIESRDPGLREGQRILLPPRAGSWREELCVPASECLRLESELAPEAAATLRINGLSARFMLDEARLAAGEAFLVAPGSSSTGQYLCALGRARGLKPIALVRRPERADVARTAGAVEVRVVDETELRPRQREARVGFDGAGGPISATVCAHLRDEGRLVSFGAMSREPAQVPVADSVFRGVQLQGFWLHRATAQFEPSVLHEAVRELEGLDFLGELEGCYALQDYRAALAAASDPQRSGRVLFRTRAA